MCVCSCCVYNIQYTHTEYRERVTSGVFMIVQVCRSSCPLAWKLLSIRHLIWITQWFKLLLLLLLPNKCEVVEKWTTLICVRTVCSVCDLSNYKLEIENPGRKKITERKQRLAARLCNMIASP